MRNLFICIYLLPLLFLSKSSFGQDTLRIVQKQAPPPKFFLINGRVIGVHLEDLGNVIIQNIRTAEKDSSDSHGFFKINAAKGDTLIFTSRAYSKWMQVIKSPKERLNLILIKRKAAEIPEGAPPSELKKAMKADEELMRILEKDAAREGKWSY